MLGAFLLSLGQLGDRKIIAVFLKSFALTVLLIALLGAGLWYAGQRGIEALGWNPDLGALVGTVALLIAFGLGWLLFRAVAVAVMGVFADDVVIAVERKHYPQALAGAHDVSIARGIGLGLRSAGRAILINLALVPVYIMLLVTGVGTALLFFLVNGWLLGNDFGQMVAARHMDDATIRDWRKTGAVDRFALGVAGTALFMIPILNLFAPIIGAAMATHLFHKGRTA